VGREGRELSIPALRLEPGRYYASVLQDLDPRGGKRAPFVHENVSDPYTITVAIADPPGMRSAEIEPNDEPASANIVAPGETMQAAIAWLDDQDVFCASPSTEGRSIRWITKDVVRDAGSVLEVAPSRGRETGKKVRVHALGEGTTSQDDVRSPWTSAPIPAEPDVTRCLVVRLARDPWLDDAPRVPTGGPEVYSVGLDITP
jgi:hypothetical protein